MDITKIEVIQKRAARFAANDYSKSPGSMTDIPRNLQWTSLEKRREINSLTLFYKIVNNQSAINIDNYLEPFTRQSRKYHNQAYRPLAPTYVQILIFPRTIIVWNTLQQYVVSADSIDGFKSAMAACIHP